MKPNYPTIKEGTFVTKKRGVETFISLWCNKKAGHTTLLIVMWDWIKSMQTITTKIIISNATSHVHNLGLTTSTIKSTIMRSYRSKYLLLSYLCLFIWFHKKTPNLRHIAHFEPNSQLHRQSYHSYKLQPKKHKSFGHNNNEMHLTHPSHTQFHGHGSLYMAQFNIFWLPSIHTSRDS
jgi:hypothetical protein